MAQIPDDLRRFILTSVPSVPYLEAMLLLRAGPGADWQAADLARRLYIPQQKAEELLQQLVDAGLVSNEGPCWRWRPAGDAAALVDRLAHIYAGELVEVTELIHTREERRARQFADAFRLRKKEE